MWEPEAMPSPETMAMVESMACKLLSEDEVAAVMRHCNRVSIGLCIYPKYSMSAKHWSVEYKMRMVTDMSVTFCSLCIRDMFYLHTVLTDKQINYVLNYD